MMPDNTGVISLGDHGTENHNKIDSLVDVNGPVAITYKKILSREQYLVNILQKTANYTLP